MCKPCIAHSLLSLFTAPDRAVSIVGDLTEEARSRGTAWFWAQTLGIASALCFKRVIAGPWRSLGLATVGFVAWSLVYSILIVTSGLLDYLPSIFGNGPLSPDFSAAPWGFWIRIVLDLSAANLLTGLMLGRWASGTDMNGIAPLVVFWLASWASWPFLAEFVYSLSWQWNVGLGFAIPFLYLLPLVVGGAWARRRYAASACSGATG